MNDRISLSAADVRLSRWVELVVVIVIASASSPRSRRPRFFNDRHFPSSARYYEELTGRAQVRAEARVAERCPVRFDLAANGYQARQQAGRRRPSCNPSDATWATGRAARGRQLLSGTSPIGVSASPGRHDIFDALGGPDPRHGSETSPWPVSL